MGGFGTISISLYQVKKRAVMYMFVSGIDYVSVSTIIILYFETVLTEWYFWFFIKLILITILMEYLFCLNQRNHS